MSEASIKLRIKIFLRLLRSSTTFLTVESQEVNCLSRQDVTEAMDELLDELPVHFLLNLHGLLSRIFLAVLPSVMLYTCTTNTRTGNPQLLSQ
jgi:hypothetical protein